MITETVVATLRHARTPYGAERRYAGSIDVPLSEQGERDCVAAAEALHGAAFDVVITSTLRRAIDTARLLRLDGATHVQCDLCRERGFGVLEGLTFDQAKSLDPPVLFVQVGDDVHSVNPAGGEPFEVVWERARRFSRHVFRKYEGSRVLVVSHGVFLQMLHGVLRGSNCIESLGSYPGNLELTSFRFSDRTLVDEQSTTLSALVGGF